MRLHHAALVSSSEANAAGLKIKLVPKGDSQICFVQDFDGNQFEIKQAIS